MQLVWTLGLLGTAQAERVVEPVLRDLAADAALLEALLAGLAGREAEFLAVRLAQQGWAQPEPWRRQLLTACAGVVWRQRQPLAVLRFLHLLGAQAEGRTWQQLALLDGLKAVPPGKGSKGKAPPRVLPLPTVPESLQQLRKAADPKVAAAAERVAGLLNWPGKDGKALPVPPPLSEKHQALYDRGRKEYAALCAACHHTAGYGDAGKGPSLLDSEWLDHDERLVRLVLHGLRGPVTVNGEVFNRAGDLEMPGMYLALDDRKIAAIVTFVRREWREGAPPLEPATVARIRAATAGRTRQWTEPELLKVK